MRGLDKWAPPKVACGLALVSLCGLAVLVPAGYLKFKTRHRVKRSCHDAGMAEAIVVLGAKVGPSGEPSPMLASRLDIGIQMFDAGVAPTLVLSGIGGRDTDNEISAMVRTCVAAGVPMTAVEVDGNSRTTEASVAYAASKFPRHAKLVFVSQSYHLPRVLFVAERLGLDPVAVTAAPRVNVKQIYRSLREWVARASVFYSGVCRSPGIGQS